MSVIEKRFRYTGADETLLAGFLWHSDQAPRIVLQLAHGAGEHAGRYPERLAPLIEAGVVVYAADHRGHGLTSGMSHLGDFGPGGADACVSDMAALSDVAREQYPDLPLVLMGHSMGAMFAQVYLLRHSAKIDALVLSGTTGPGPRYAGAWSSAFPEGRTDYDWLSRDFSVVDRYIADPFCGIRFLPESLMSVMALSDVANAAPGLDQLAKADLPLYVFVGEKDPVHNHLEGLQPLIDRYRAVGLAVTFKVYPDGRHEMLNEPNHAEVAGDLLTWIESAVGDRCE